MFVLIKVSAGVLQAGVEVRQQGPVHLHGPAMQRRRGQVSPTECPRSCDPFIVVTYDKNVSRLHEHYIFYC